MKILVISDTHGDIDGAESVIRKNKDAGLIIHLGDYFRDAKRLSSIFPHLRFEYICGNCDFMIGDVPPEKCLEIAGIRIFLTHGHRYSVKWDYTRLMMKAHEEKADILLFGHTHIPGIIEGNGYCLVNPGSTSDPRGDSDESYAIIEINGNETDIKLCRV
jgi:putative phosphoesterase